MILLVNWETLAHCSSEFCRSFSVEVQNEECRISKHDKDDETEYDMDYDSLQPSSHYKVLNYTVSRILSR